MFKKISIMALIVVFPYQTNASNGQLPAILPLTKLVFTNAHNTTSPWTKEGWKPVQQCEDIDRLWNSGVRMMKISIQWYQPDSTNINKINANGYTSPQVSNDRPKPYLALCREKPANNNCPVTRMQRAGKDPQSLQQFLKKLATLLQNNPQEVFILKIVNHMYQRSAENGAAHFNETQLLQMFKRELELSGLDRLALSLTNHRQPLMLGEMRNSRRLIILDDHSALRLSQYVNSYKDYTSQLGQGNILMEKCLHIHVYSKNKLKSVAFHNKIHKSRTIEAVRKCYVDHGVSPGVANTSFANIGDINQVIKNLKNIRRH